MTQAVDTLPDDPETLKAMLIAERIRSERLVEIIKDLQRHRFGRRAETLLADQLCGAAVSLAWRTRRSRKMSRAYPGNTASVPAKTRPTAAQRLRAPRAST